MKCAVCIELNMIEKKASETLSYYLTDAITQIDGTVLCQEHAEQYIKARHENYQKKQQELSSVNMLMNMLTK